MGRDVESMVRDLAECAIRLVREEKTAEVEYRARATAERKVAKVLAENNKQDRGELSKEIFEQNFVDAIHEGKYDNAVIEIEVADQPKPLELSAGSGAAIDLGSIFGGMGLPGKRKRRKLTVKEAVNLLMAEEADKLIDNDAVNAEAIKRAENDGIIFIDEIDKIAGKGNQGADVSREGVQRDILPIVEGCTVMTKYGPIKTDYILFIAAGAFHVSKVEDLIPELQGRFPIQVELSSLTKKDFIDILTQPQNAITRQYSVLLAVDNIDLHFTDDAIEKIAEVNFENQLPGIPRFSWMKKRFYTNGVLRAGCLLSGVGIGLLSAYFIVLCSLPDYLSQDYSYGVRLFGDIVFFASTLLGGGAGLIIAYWVEQKHDKKSE